VSYFGSWKLVSSAWDLQLKNDSQREKEPMDTEAKDTPPLEAATKQRSEDHDWERQSMWQWFVKVS
jgi:hypothetical protein